MRISDWRSDVCSSDLRARAPFSELYNVGFFFDDQIIRAKVTQNINSRLNIGGEFQAARADGYYINQRYNDLKSAVFAWYESEKIGRASGRERVCQYV